MLAEDAAFEGVSLHPRMLRHIFVHHRLEHDDIPGPSHEDAAKIMGNSVQQWRKSYHTTANALAAKRAVPGQQAWREAVVKAVPAIKVQVEEPRALTCNSHISHNAVKRQKVLDPWPQPPNMATPACSASLLSDDGIDSDIEVSISLPGCGPADSSSFYTAPEQQQFSE